MIIIALLAAFALGYIARWLRDQYRDAPWGYQDSSGYHDYTRAQLGAELADALRRRGEL